MLTVLESIRLSTEYLEKKGIESPRINAELLLAHILNCKRLDLYLSYDRPLSEEEIVQYREFLKRRGQSEPYQYIVGTVEFFGLPFEVNPSVLIPRPETEILVEEIINQYKNSGEVKILDIGTGSGNIAVSLAYHIKNAKIFAADINQDALEVAKINAVNNKIESQISFVKNDITKDILDEHGFDLIVSNPPYVSEKDFNELRPELRIYEPRNALTDNSDGLIYYRQISAKAKNLLKNKGKIFFEIGEGQAEKVKKILEENNFSDIKIKNDYLHIERVISGEIS
jgi:release factor glutamine methyltransferase